MKMIALEKLFVNRPAKAQRNMQRLAQHLRQLDADAIHDVLELGCGIGAVSAFLANELDASVCGTDYDPDQIRLARRTNAENERLRFGVEDASRLSFARNSFDLVVSQNVFHHLPNWPVAIQEIARVLRPGGHLIWYDLAFPKLLGALLGPLLSNYGLYTYEQVHEGFLGCGFEVRFAEQVAHGPIGHHDLVLERPGG
ncbi:MAG: class I SAM-dependent methyltransferase [bacterium]|nr:class I SAM-dependent methyltransferase [bacterium]